MARIEAVAMMLFRTRRDRARTLSVLVTALVVGAIVAVNVVASRATGALDLTHAGLNTLAPESVLAAKRLTSDLNVVGMWLPNTVNGQSDAEALVALYAAQSPHVKYRAEDWTTDLADVRRYAITVADTLVLDYRSKTELLLPGSQGEVDFTAALLKLESDRVPLVCWTTGDGERSLTDANQATGYSAVADLLAKNNFAMRDLLLSQATSIPIDCDELAIVAPTKPLSASAVKALEAYLTAGGKLLLAADPWENLATTSSLSDVLKPYGLALSGALIVETDPSRIYGSQIVPAISNYGTSPITTDIKGFRSVFPESTAITGTPDPAATVVPIARTTSGSYAVNSPRQDYTTRKAGDVAGPFTIMETLEQAASQKKTRIVIVGTGAFGENYVLPPNSGSANVALALGAFQWLAEQDSLISIPPKPSRSLPLTLTQQDQSTLIFITSVLMPGLMVFGGVMVWWRRRVFR